jgi:hypothetical protein
LHRIRAARLKEKEPTIMKSESKTEAGAAGYSYKNI